MDAKLSLPLVAKNLRYLMDANKLTSTSLAEATQQNQPTIHRIVNGEVSDPRASTLEPLAKYFGTTVNLLRSYDFESQADVNVIPNNRPRSDALPVLSWVQAGQWADSISLSEIEEWRSTTKRHSDKSFALKVKGISMYNPGHRETFEEGDIILVDPERPAHNGSLVIAMLADSGECTFKKLYQEDGHTMLKALNPNWSPQYIKLESETQIIGVVFEKQVDFG